MLVAALVVSDSLGFGFDRAAKAADLPDIIVRFNPQTLEPRRAADHRAARHRGATRCARRSPTSPSRPTISSPATATVEVVGAGPHGYAIVAGRELSSRFGEVVVERGPGRRLGASARRHARHRRPRPAADRRLLREPRQRLLSARGPARVRVGGGDRLSVRVPVQPPGESGRDLAARPAPTSTRCWFKRAPPATAWRDCASSPARECGCCSTRRRGS